MSQTGTHSAILPSAKIIAWTATLALVAGGILSDACGQMQRVDAEDVSAWNATAASSRPWQGLSGNAEIIRDSSVQQADFRSGNASTFATPDFDAATNPNSSFASGSANSSLPSVEVNVEDMESSAGNPSGWIAGFKELVGTQFGSINWTRMVGSLAVVVAGYLLLVWLFRLASRGGNGRLPSSVFELVGSARLNNRQSLQLVRIGGRLLMLIVSPEGAQPVGEISHPGEVETLVAQCSTRFGRKKTGKGYPARLDQSTRPMGATLEQLVAALQQSTGNAPGKHEFEA